MQRLACAEGGRGVLARAEVGRWTGLGNSLAGQVKKFIIHEAPREAIGGF